MGIFRGFVCALLAGSSIVAAAGEFETTVVMRTMDAATFYVTGQISGVGAVDLMVDTGSGGQGRSRGRGGSGAAGSSGGGHSAASFSGRRGR
jgi:hypothetical protein